MRGIYLLVGVGVLAYFYFKGKKSPAAQLGGSGDPGGPDPLGLSNLPGTGVQGSGSDPLNVMGGGGVSGRTGSGDPLGIGQLKSSISLDTKGDPTFGNG